MSDESNVSQAAGTTHDTSPSEAVPLEAKPTMFDESSTSGVAKTPEIVNSVRRVVTDLITGGPKKAKPRHKMTQENRKDTPAMITLRKASIRFSIHQGDAGSPIESRTKSDQPPRRFSMFSSTSACAIPPIHPLLRTSTLQNIRRTSEVETALTLVNAHASLAGAETAPSNLAERRSSAVAVIVTGQRSHEIIWRREDTPSSGSSSSSERQSQTSLRVLSSRQGIAVIQE